MLPDKTQRAVDLACEKGASNWLTLIALKDMGFDLNKREFHDAVRLRCDWPIPIKRLWEHVYSTLQDHLPAWRISYSSPQ